MSVVENMHWPRRLSNRLVLPLIVSAALVGCFGEDGPPVSTISGQVTLDGEPVTVGIVQFVNEELAVGANGKLDDDGRYFIDTPFLTGTYQVAILPPPPPDPILGGDPPKGPFVVPKRYTSFETSGFTAELTEGENEFDIPLRK